MTFPKSTWRLLKTKAAPGPWNMAVDEAILEAVSGQNSLPTLRFYSWEPACLSLGYAQALDEVDQEALAQNGWDVVRRPTGGRAILHTDELTYSVIGLPDDPRLEGGVLESYQRLSKALLLGLQRLSLPAQINEKKKKEEQSEVEPICFEVPSNYEITVDGKKLIGSAQARKKGGVLQHGTVPLYGDLTRITQALRFDNEEKRERVGQRLLSRATTVEEVVKRVVSWEEAAGAFGAAFEEELSFEWEQGELSASERERAEELVETKYGAEEWTARVSSRSRMARMNE
ncbi:MAG: lipoate--protein ligase family protein [Chloroflexi bacterium]|nr:MAG: lipoate--protein ligase family protein [Chloroflexota bacterium]MBL1195982.1 lipoate--protein ligase family protein [Chloroflexota bacterium]NOH13276.1 lipoate--protein ligase family protein [Chloroflexota bacterium]